jgi:hypothetical protein
MSHFILVKCKLQHASPVWNSNTITDTKNLESIEQKFALIYFTLFYIL